MANSEATFNRVIGNELHLARTRLKWSQKTAAAETGIAYGTYRRYEDGTRTMPLPLLCRSAPILHLDLDAIIQSATPTEPTHPATPSTTQPPSPPTLAEIINHQKTTRGFSYRDLQTRASDTITSQRWQQLGTGMRIREFPEPATLQAMADALEVNIAAVVLAAARSIGLPVKRAAESELAEMLPASAALLTPEQRDAILALVRSITQINSSHTQPGDNT